MIQQPLFFPYPKENRLSKRDMYSHIYSIIHNGQDMDIYQQMNA